MMLVAAGHGLAAAEEPVATWKGGSLTAHDIALYAQAVRYPYSDPVAAMRNSHDEAERKDAATFVELIAKERAWDQAWAARARTRCPDMEATVAALARPLFAACVAAHWRDQVLKQFTTPTVEQIVEAGLTKYRGTFEHEEMREVQYIFRATTGTRTQEERDKIRGEMQELYTLLVEHRINFSDAAKLYSQVPSSTRGGRLGVISKKERFNPRFMEFIFSLPKNEVSSPTLLHNGYYIAQVTQIYPEERLTTDSIKASQALQEQIMGMMRNDFVTEQARKLVGKDVPTTGITDAMIATAALEKMSTPTDCMKKELFFRERVLARTCFLDSNADRLRPTEAEARAYFTSNSKALRKGGYLKYTRFFVPYSTDRYPTRKAAMEPLTAFRTELEAHPSWSMEQIRKIAAEKGVEVLQLDDWVMASDDPKADDELVRIAPGTLTSNVVLENGVAFYRLDGRRERPQQTFDEVRDLCFEQARNRKAWQLVQESMEETAKELGVKILIPLPR
jgi:hypothetical protein